MKCGFAAPDGKKVRRTPYHMTVGGISCPRQFIIAEHMSRHTGLSSSALRSEKADAVTRSMGLFALLATGVIGLTPAAAQGLWPAGIQSAAPQIQMPAPAPRPAPMAPAPLAQATPFGAPAAEPAPMTPAPSGPRGPSAYNSVVVDGPYIALTFDDGPSPDTTPKLLKILADRGVKATFYVVGRQVAAYPDVLKQVAAAGHEIGNHSWSHPILSKIKLAEAERQIEDTSAAIEKVTGEKPKTMRPPYGAMSPGLRKHIEDKYGLSLIYWSVDPLDWKHKDAKRVHDVIVANTQPGGIVLAHDIHPTTVAAMPSVIDDLKAKGFKFVTVSELIAMHRPELAKVAAVNPAPVKKKPKPVQATGSTARPAAPGAARPAAAPKPATGAKPATAPRPVAANRTSGLF